MKHIKIKLLMKFIFLFLGVLFSGSVSGQTKPKVDLEYNFSVGSYSGMLNYQRTDIDIPGLELAPEAIFAYNGAKINKDWGYGNGWTFTYNVLYELDTLRNFVVYKNDGSKHIFTRTRDGFIAPSSAPYDKLEEYIPGKYRLKIKSFNTYYYYFDNNKHKRITAIENLNKKRITLTYSDSLLIKVTDPVAREISFKWNNGHLVQIFEENTTVKRTFTYTYDEHGNMIKMTNPMGYSVRYNYDAENRLVFFSDENGNPLKIEYKDKQVVKKVSTCMHSVAFTYDATNRKTFVLEDVDGQKVITTYAFDEKGRNIERVGNCCGYNVKMEYDDKNNVTKKQDGEGNAVFYFYDAQGNVKKETDEDGGQVKFTYDTITYKMLSRTDEFGNTTNYSYDERGNVTKIMYPLGISESFKYNENGNILSHTNKNGDVTTYTYDEHEYLSVITNPDKSTRLYKYNAIGKLLSEKDENGNETTFEYDKMCRAVKRTDPLGNVSEITYDAKGNEIQYKDANGNATKYEYDPLDRQISVTTPMGFKTTKSYDNRGNVIAETDANGNETRYTYNSFDLVTSETDPAGNKKYYTYDAAGKKIEESDKMGNVMTFQYNKSGRLIKQTNPLGHSLSYGYDIMGNLISEKDGDGYITTYKYDALGRKISKTDPAGNEEKYGYDNMNNLIYKKDKNGNETRYYYDNRGRKYKTMAPLNDVIEFTFDAVGKELTRSMAAGIVNHYKYDKMNRKIQDISAMGEVTSYEYDAEGNQIKITQPNGNVITKEYDKDNRLLTTSDKEGIISSHTYDKIGAVIKEIDADGITTIKRYNVLGQQTEEVDANGNVKKTEYNPNGAPVSVTDVNQRVTQFQYNAGGVVTKTISPEGDVSLYDFDARGNLISLTDAKGNTTAFTYDALNRKVATTFPDGSVEKLEYDPNGNVVTKKTAEGTTSYSYDALNRQTKIKHADGSQSAYAYDQLSRMTSAANDNVTVSFKFDNDSRLLKEQVGDKAFTYTYDNQNRKTTIAYPSGKVITEELDYIGRPVKVVQGSATVSAITYTGTRIDQNILGNGLVTNYTFNKIGKVEDISVNSGSVLQFKYTYDIKGNALSKEAMHHPAFSEVFAYSSKGQLTFYQKGTLTQAGIPNPLQTIDYSYDKLGNLVSKNNNGTTFTFTSNNLNQYTQVTSGSRSDVPSYSANGNLISYNQASYSYDSDSRLTKAGNVTYKYDALGRRYQRIESGKTTTYYYYKDQLATELDNSGNTVEYIYAGTTDLLLAMITSGQTNYYHFNESGSVAALSNSAGTVEEYYEYSPYGEVSFYNSEFSQVQKPASGNRILFAGSSYDFATGLYYMRSRDYHPQLGRFLQRDPISFKGGTHNLYEYVHSNPVNFKDPYGLKNCVSGNTSASWGGDRVGIGYVGRNMGGALYKGEIKIQYETESCSKCCSGNDGKQYVGSEYTSNVSISGSISANINGLVFFPASRAFLIAAQRLGIDIFAGVRISGSASGNVNYKVDCGKVSGGGNVSYKIETSGEISLSLTQGYSETRKAKVSGSGSVTGSFSQQGSVSFSDTGAKRECETKWGAEAQLSYSIEYTWKFWSVSIKESIVKDLGSGESKACPPGL
jgi:RHS repeat-associated protein